MAYRIVFNNNCDMYYYRYYYGFDYHQKDVKPLQVDKEVPQQETQTTKITNNPQERV